MEEKRSRPRLKVSMLVEIIGRTIDGEVFKEVCQTHDASAFGLCLIIEAIIPKSSIVFLSMQMPRRLRLYDLSTDIYHIYAQVQRVQMLVEGGCEIGLSFIGKNPPQGAENYQTLRASLAQNSFSETSNSQDKFSIENPSSISFQTNNSSLSVSSFSKPSIENITSSKELSNNSSNSDLSPSSNLWERPGRRDARLTIPMDALIYFLDSTGKAVHQEPGLVTNISRHGACVMATKDALVGSRVKINLLSENFEAISSIKAVTTGQGGVWNLHLEFLDRCWMGGS